MPLNVNDVVRVVYAQELFSQRLYTVLNYRVDVPAAPGTTEAEEMAALADRMADQALAPLVNWLPVVGDELLFSHVRAQKVAPVRGVYQQALIVAEGSHVDPCTTANVAASITKRTLTPGRTGVGRVQLGGIPQTAYTEGTLDPAYLSLLEDFKDDLINFVSVPANGSAYRLCVWNGQIATEDIDVFELTVQHEVRTMHRRTVRLGE